MSFHYAKFRGEASRGVSRRDGSSFKQSKVIQNNTNSFFIGRECLIRAQEVERGGSNGYRNIVSGYRFQFLVS